METNEKQRLADLLTNILVFKVEGIGKVIRLTDLRTAMDAVGISLTETT